MEISHNQDQQVSDRMVRQNNRDIVLNERNNQNNDVVYDEEQYDDEYDDYEDERYEYI